MAATTSAHVKLQGGRLVDVADMLRLFVFEADWDVALEGVDEAEWMPFGVAV